MEKLRLYALLGAAVATAVFTGPASATSYLANGSFETGDFTGWTQSGNFEFTGVVSGPTYAYSGAQDGNFYVVSGAVNSLGYLSQTFADVAGKSLLISGWLNAIGEDPSEFTVSFNGTPLLDLTDPNTGGTWQNGSFNVTATGSDTLTIGFQDNPGYIAFDNVSVTSVSATPLPAALPLFASGLGGLGLLGWRKKKKAQTKAA